MSKTLFYMALSGHTIPEIVKMLNQAGIPTPGTLTEKNYKGKQMMVRKNTAVICWQYNMVRGILKNRVYTGACVNSNGARQHHVVSIQKRMRKKNRSLCRTAMRRL